MRRTVVDAAHRGRFGPYRSLEHQPRRRPLCHWSFDQGLLGVSSKYLLLLSGELRITQNMAGYLLTLENRSIIGPQEEELWPQRERLQWHQQNVFRRG
jgi:putative restriction endonuclease